MLPFSLKAGTITEHDALEEPEAPAEEEEAAAAARGALRFLAEVLSISRAIDIATFVFVSPQQGSNEEEDDRCGRPRFDGEKEG